MSEWRTGKNSVSFQSEGVTLKGNLFLPDNFDSTSLYPGVVVGGTWTSVKEQMSDRYAERLAQHGYVTLDYDFRNYGESGGEPRQFESPALKIEDNRHAVSYLASLPFVDANRIGAVGICASAGYMSGTVASDERVKSLALVAPWLHDAALVREIYGGEAGVQHRLDMADAARRKYEIAGDIEYVLACDPNDPDAAMPFPLDFYLNPARGALPQWTNRFAVMAWREWLEFDGIQYGAQLHVPLLIIHSETAAVPEGAKAYFSAVTAPKDIIWTQGDQLDFYDQEPQVSKSVEAVANHFERTLSGDSPMTTHEQAVSVVQQFFAHLEAMDMESFFALWAADGRQEMPFAPEGFPSLLEGIDAVKRQYGGLPDAYGRMVFPGLVLRPLNEPDWVFAEYRGQIELLNGGVYNNQYCGLFHIENGKIVLFREYFNPVILQQSFGNSLGSTFSVQENP